MTVLQVKYVHEGICTMSDIQWENECSIKHVCHHLSIGNKIIFVFKMEMQ